MFFKIMTTTLTVLMLTFALVACGGEQTTEEDMTTSPVSEMPHGEGKAYTSPYVCPMHCEGSGSEEAGNCPVCGMAYVEHDEHTSNGHEH